MAPTKHRGKTLSGSWVYGYLIGPDAISTLGATEVNFTFTYVDPQTIGLFTGRLDLHEKEIYEGQTVIGKHHTKVYYAASRKTEIKTETWKGKVKWLKTSCKFVVEINDFRGVSMLSCHEYEIVEE